MAQNKYEIAQGRLLEAQDDLSLLESVCSEQATKDLLVRPDVGEGWKTWIELRREALTPAPAAPIEPAPATPIVEPEKADKVTAASVAEPEAFDILAIGAMEAENREAEQAAWNQGYDALISAAREANVFLTLDARVPVENGEVGALRYFVEMILSGVTATDVLAEAERLGLSSPFSGASSDAYDAVIDAAKKAHVYIFPEVKLSDGRKIRPIVELAKVVDTGVIKPAKAIEIAEKAGWTGPPRKEDDNSGFATVRERVEAKEAARSKGGPKR